MQINYTLFPVPIMNNRHMIFVAAMAIMLIGATAFSTTDNVFADGKKKYEKSQAASQVNECGNGELPLNVFCQNLLSQIQGDGNAANIIAVQ
jgi:NADH:ubiquinone oxidoreductase subunit F (NADH-binding)